LSSEVVSEVLKDHEGNLWLGFLGEGLARWQGYRKWEGWTQEEGLNSNAVWTLLRDGQKTLWAGTDGGVNFMPQGARRWESPLGKSNQSIGRVMSFAQENPQIIWAASQTKGLIRIDTRDRSLQIVGFPANAGVKYLHGILIDSKRRLWLGTSMGLFEASVDQPLRWNPVESAKQEEPESIYTISEDSSGRIWAAGDAGILVKEPQRWSRIQKKDWLAQQQHLVGPRTLERRSLCWVFRERR